MSKQIESTAKEISGEEMLSEIAGVDHSEPLPKNKLQQFTEKWLETIHEGASRTMGERLEMLERLESERKSLQYSKLVESLISDIKESLTKFVKENYDTSFEVLPSTHWHQIKLEMDGYKYTISVSKDD